MIELTLDALSSRLRFPRIYESLIRIAGLATAGKLDASHPMKHNPPAPIHQYIVGGLVDAPQIILLEDMESWGTHNRIEIERN